MKLQINPYLRGLKPKGSFEFNEVRRNGNGKQMVK